MTKRKLYDILTIQNYCDEDIVVSEDSEIVNADEECPYCYSMDGFKIVGQVAPYEKEEVKVEVEPKNESLTEAISNELPKAIKPYSDRIITGEFYE